MPNKDNEIIIDKVINSVDLPDLNARGSKGKAIRQAYEPGCKVFNKIDNCVYTVIENGKERYWEKELDTLIPGTYIRIKSFNNALYVVTDNGISKIQTEDVVPSKDSKKTLDSTAVKALKVISPRTWNIVKQNNILSVYEIILPLILDRLDYFDNSLSDRLAAARTEISRWLKTNGFIYSDDHGNLISTDKFIEREDCQNFAALICDLTQDTKTLNRANVDFEFLNSEFFKKNIKVNLNSDYDFYLKKDPTQNDSAYPYVEKFEKISIDDIISKLRNSGYLYSSQKDVAIRNIVNGSFRDEEGYPIMVKSKDGQRVIPLADSYFESITKPYKQIIDFDNLKNSLASAGVDVKKLDSSKNVLEIYDELKNINTSSIKLDGDLKNKLDYIVSNCSPSALVFFLFNIQSDIREELNTNLNVSNKNHLLYNNDNEEIKEIIEVRNVLLLNVEPFVREFNKLLNVFDTTLNFKPFEYLENPDYLSNGKGKGQKFELPKNINPVDPTKAIQLMNPQLIDESRIHDYLIGISKADLQSALAGLNERSEQELVNFFSTVLFINFLNTEYNMDISLKDFYDQSITQLPDLKANPYAKSQIITAFPILKKLKLVFNNLLSVLKPEIRNIKEILRTIIEGRNSLDTQSNTEEAIYDIRSLFNALADYMENRDIYSLNYNDLLDNLLALNKSSNRKDRGIVRRFNSQYTLLSGIDYTEVKQLENYSEELKPLLRSLEVIVNANNNELAKQKLNEIPGKAERIVGNIKTAISDEIARKNTQNESTDEKVDQETFNAYYADPFQMEASVYNRFRNLIRQSAIKQFTEQDFNDMLVRLKEDGAEKNKLTASLSKNSLDLYNTAMTIINLFGLKNKSNKTKIDEVLQAILSDNQKYSSMYNCILDMNVVNNNSVVLGSLIYKILHAQKTYDYDDIKNNILSYTGNLSVPISVTTDIEGDFVEYDKKYSAIFKNLGITTVIALNTQNALQQVLNADPKLKSTALWVYIANKLYYEYYEANINNKYLTEYLKYNKFSLVLDVADSFTKNGKAISNDIVQGVKANQKKMQYFFNAGLVVNRLDKIRYYKDMPESLKNAYANNKILSTIDARLYQQITENPNFNLLIQNCNNIDFNDYIVGNILTGCKIYDLQGNLIKYDKNSGNPKTNNIRNLLDEVRLNSTKLSGPNYSDEKLPEDKIMSLFNKLKGSNAVGLIQNSVVMSAVLDIAEERYNDVLDTKNSVSSKLKDLKQDTKDLVKSMRQSTLSVLNNINNTLKKSKNPDLLNSSETKFKEVLLDCSTSMNNLEPELQFEFDSNLKYIDDKFNALEKLFREAQAIETNQGEDVINALLSYVTHWKAEHRNISDFVDAIPLSNKDRKNPYAKGFDKISPIHIEVNTKALNASWTNYLKSTLTQGNEVIKLKNKVDTLYNIVIQDFHNGLSSSKCSVSNAIQLKELINKIDQLKIKFNNSIVGTLTNQPGLQNSQAVETKVPSPEYVLAQVNELRNTIRFKLSLLVQNSVKMEQIIDSIMKICSELYTKFNIINHDSFIIDDCRGRVSKINTSDINDSVYKIEQMTFSLKSIVEDTNARVHKYDNRQ